MKSNKPCNISKLKFYEKTAGLSLGSKLLLNRGKRKFWSNNFDPQLTYCVNTNSQWIYSICKRIRTHTYILTLWLVLFYGCIQVYLCSMPLFESFQINMKFLMMFLIFQRNLRHNLPFGRNQLSPRRSHDARRYCCRGRTLGWRSNGLCQRDDSPTWSRNRSWTNWQRWKLHWLVFCRQYKYQVRIHIYVYLCTITM